MTCSIFCSNEPSSFDGRRARCGDSCSYGDCAGFGEETACEEARQVIQALMVLVNRGMTVGTPDVVTAIGMVKNDEIDKFVALYEEEIIKDNTGETDPCQNLGQKLYVDSVKQHDVTFGIGPQGREDLSCSDLGSDSLNAVRSRGLF